MQITLLVVFLVVLGAGVIQTVSARPFEESKDTKNAAVYILGNIYNAAISQEFSKSQAASDRKESEWNSTNMMNSKNINKERDEANVNLSFSNPNIGPRD